MIMTDKTKKQAEQNEVYKECERLIKHGVTEFADKADGAVAEAVRKLKGKYPDILLATDCEEASSDGIIKFYK